MITSRLFIKNRRLNFYPYFFIAPFFLVFIVFSVFPTIFTFITSFTEWNGFDTMQIIGFGNYLDLFQDPIFIKSVTNTFKLVFVMVPLEVTIALVIAFILNTYFKKIKHYFETIYFLPYLTSPIAVGILFSVVFGYRYGLFNWALRALNIISEDIDWIGNPRYAIAIISIVCLWKAIGYTIVIFIAGLQTIPTELYESARIDGAGITSVFIKITLPLLKPVITFVVITTIIGDFQLFSEPFMIFNGGGTNNSAMTMVTYLYQSAFQFGRSGYGAAISYALFFIILVFSQMVLKIMTRSDESE